jgi:formylglycine-generating enzyme required for sulfatase activity
MLLLSCDREPPTATVASGLAISGQVSVGADPAPDVEIRLLGDLEATATTDSLGNYLFPDLISGLYAVRPTLSGFSFTPLDLDLELKRGNLADQDFTMVPDAPRLLLDKPAIDFTTVEIGKPRTIQLGLGNLGKANLSVSSVSSSSSLFSVSGTSFSIQQDSLVFIDVTFSPTGTTPTTAELTVDSNDPDAPQKTVSLNGRGVDGGSAQISISPSQLNFSSVKIGSGASLKLTLTNNGSDILHLDSVLTTNPAFSFSLPANVLAFGRSLEMGITFIPADTGTVSAQLRIVSDASNAPNATVGLTGTGFSSLPSSISIEPEALVMGSVFRDSVGSATITVGNIGSDSLIITALRISGEGFSTPPGSTAVIAPGNSHDFVINFSSASLGLFNGTLTIFHSAAQQLDVIVPLEAEVFDLPPEAIRIHPDTLDFDSTGVGGVLVRQLWIVNPNSVPLSVWDFQFSDSTYSVETDSVPVPAGDSIPLSIKFFPQEEGSFPAQLAMQTNVVDLPTATVELSGIGYQTVTGKIELPETRLDFGTQALGSVTEANLTVSNDGANRLALRTVSADNPMFVVTSMPDTISPGQGGTITLEFRPSTVGLFSSNLLISSSDPSNLTTSVTLIGGGVDTSASGTALLRIPTRLLDMGQVVENLTGSALLNIGNIGKDTLRIAGFNFSHDEFSASPSQLSVPPGSELPVTVTFAPVVSGEVNATMVLFSNDQLRSTDTIQVRGTGVTEGGIVEGREIFIQGGSFLMGFSGEEGPVRQVTLSSFFIDVFEVTNEQYKEFIDAGGYDNRAYWSDEGWDWRQSDGDLEYDPQNPRPRYWAASGIAPWESDPYSNRAGTPVVGVSWYEADAFARFRGKSLPTEAQWEYATRGAQGRIYPWGDILLPDRLNHGQLFSPYYDESDGYKHASSVAAFPDGQSPEGVFGLSGNVMEWIADWYGPYETAQTNNPTGPFSGIRRVLRGGSWAGSVDFTRGFHRNKSEPNLRYRDGGFRLVRNF